MRTTSGVAAAVSLLALTLPAHAGAQGDLDARCGPREVTSSTSAAGGHGVAQQFTALRTGRLTVAQVEIQKLAADVPADWLVQINEVDAAGVPTYSNLASATVPFSSAPVGDSTINGEFAAPPTVEAGQQYALVISRPGGDVLRVGQRIGEDDCPGRKFSFTPPNPFLPIGTPADDLAFATFVLENDPPETTITKGPKNRTRKRRARFEFTSDEPGASFACAVDGQVLKVPCTSPYKVKVKRGKHTFRVQATDAAGNVDAEPATDDWKVKRKKKRKK
jgi:hypothetical protein